MALANLHAALNGKVPLYGRREMTEEQIIKRYQFPGMDNVKLSALRTIFESMFDSIVDEFESENYDEPGYNYLWTMWCKYE